MDVVFRADKTPNQIQKACQSLVVSLSPRVAVLSFASYLLNYFFGVEKNGSHITSRYIVFPKIIEIRTVFCWYSCHSLMAFILTNSRLFTRQTQLGSKPLTLAYARTPMFWNLYVVIISILTLVMVLASGTHGSIG